MATKYQPALDAIRSIMGNCGIGVSATMPVLGISSEGCLVVRCGGGYLVTCRTGDPGYYSEVEVDFLSDDGRLLQLATIGRDEGCDDYEPVGEPDYQPMHVYAFDGVHEGVQTTQFITIGDGSYWYE